MISLSISSWGVRPTFLDSRFRAVVALHWCIYSVYLYLCTLPRFCFGALRGPRDPVVNNENSRVIAVAGLQGTSRR